MTTIGEAVERLSVEQIPVICLDTCDYLDVVRAVASGDLGHVQSFRRMLDALDLHANRFRPLVTYLIRHEWEQNKSKIERSVNVSLSATVTSVRRIASARVLGGLPAFPVDPLLSDTTTLVRRLVEMSESVMSLATVLEQDSLCIDRSLERVMEGRRPSHNNQIKDSIHWEHLLELSRQLVAAGHTQHRIFVSANREDFWHKEEKVYFPKLHRDLEAEANAAGLQFFGELDKALQALGI